MNLASSMADKTKNTDKIGFQLNKITTEQFAIIQDAYDNTSEEVNMTISLNFGINKDDKFIASFVKVQFEQKEKAFLIVEVGNHFKINEASWIELNKPTDKIVLPRGFAAHLVMLTIGTLRGVIHCKTDNTEFNKYILPTINVMDLIKDDVELK